MELLIVGAVGALDVGVVDAAAFADACELYVGGVEDTFLKALYLAQALAPELRSPIGLEVQGMEKAEGSQLEVDEQEEGQAIGEGLLVGIGKELSSGDGIDDRPLIWRVFVASEVLVHLDGEAFEIQDMLEVDLEVLEGLEVLPVIGTDGVEPAPLLLGLGEAVTTMDIAHGVRREGKPLLALEAIYQANAAEVGLLSLPDHQALHISRGCLRKLSGQRERPRRPRLSR